MKSVLVMGGATFVSYAMAKHLIKKGYQVDILTRGMKTIDYGGLHEHLICDRRVKDQMAKCLCGKTYDAVYDISAYTAEDVKILLEAIGEENIKRYLLCSSGAVYQQSDTAVSESFDSMGRSPLWGKYGTDKKEAEDLLIGSGVPYFIFRPTYIYGENNNLYREAYFFDSINSHKTIPVPYGNYIKTQFIHINDLTETFESAINSEHTNKIYNITHPEVVTWDTLIEKCGKAVQKEPIIKLVDLSKNKIESRTFFPFRDVTYMLDIKLLIEDGLHIPQITLEEGLKRTYNWYLEKKPTITDARMLEGIELLLKE